MAAKFLVMLQMNKICFFLMVALAPAFCKGQVNHGFMHSTGNDLVIESIFEDPNGNILVYKSPYMSMEPYGLWLFSSTGQLLRVYDRSDTHISAVHPTDSGYVLHAIDSFNYRGGVRCILVNHQLQLQREFYPTRVNWPKNHFINRSFNPLLRNGKIAYFGQFFNGSSDSLMHYGWLSFTSNLDSLIADTIQFSTDTQFIHRMFSWNDTLHFASAFLESVSIPSFAGIGTTILRKFNRQFQHVKRRNTFIPSDIPGFPRTIETSQMHGLAVNAHSVYGMSHFTAASANNFDNTRESFALYQFDHDLQIKRVTHQLVPPNRNIEFGHSLSRGVIFDKSNQYIYAAGVHATPRPLDFNDQNRTASLTILKYDTSAQLVWRKEIEIPRTFFELGAITATSDGGVLVGLSRIDSTPNPNVRNLFVVKLDSAGRHSVSVPELDAQPKITVYPNPVVDQFTLHYSQGQYESLLLYNQNGQLVYRQPLDASTNLHKVSIGHLPGGMYFYALQGKGKPVRGKVVKSPGG